MPASYRYRRANADGENMNDIKGRPRSSAGQARWRDILQIHPAAEMIRPATYEEQRVLRGDLKRHGQREPVVLVRIGQGCKQLLDGRTRLDLQEANGLQVIDADGNLTVPHRTVELPDDNAAVSYALSQNVHRRHLTREERRELIVRMLKADPSKSDRRIGAMTKTDNKTVAKVRHEQERREEIPHVENRKDSKGRRQPARKVVSSKTSAAPKPKSRSSPTTIAAPATVTQPTAQARDDAGADSTGEVERMRARIDELQAEVCQRDIKIVGFESHVEELQQLAKSQLLQIAAATCQIEEFKTKHRFRDVTGKDFLAVITELNMPVAWTPEEIIADITHPNLTPEHLRAAADLLHHIADALAVRRAQVEAGTKTSAEAAVDVVLAKDGNAVPTAPSSKVDDGLDIPASLRRSVH
jgi:ParB-like chromosome segregation protein Spo0J